MVSLVIVSHDYYRLPRLLSSSSLAMVSLPPLESIFFLESAVWCGLHRRLGAGRGIEPPPSDSSLGAFTTGPSTSRSDLLFSHSPLISVYSTRSKLETPYLPYLENKSCGREIGTS